MARSSICSNCGRDGLHEFIVEIPSSPVPELLNNNQAPSSLEAALARTTIADIGHDLQRLEEEATRVRSILDELDKCRNALRSYRHNHEGILSSIRKIPPETLGKIFLESLPENIEEQLDGERKSVISETVFRWGRPYREAVCNLGQVCQRWRDISIGTPQLWSSINLQLEGHRWHPDIKEKLETWLQRSGEVSLKVDCSLIADPFILRLWEPLLNRAHRWQNADLTIGRLCWSEVSCHFYQMPLLENLTVDLVNDSIRSPFAWAQQGSDWNIQIDAPALRSLHIRCRDESRVLPNIQIPLSQLTKLDLYIYLYLDGSASEQRVMNMLREAQKLVSCTLHFPRRSDSPSDAALTPSVQTQAPIHLPNLRYFDIQGNGPFGILYSLHTPVLTELVCSADSRSRPLSALRSLVSRSRCTIQKMAMHWHGGLESSVGGEFLECIQLMADLKSLEITDFSSFVVTEALIQGLNRTENPSLIQGLKKLKIVPVPGRHVESFVDMIESRVMPREDDHSGVALDGTFDILETVELTQVQFHPFDSEPEDKKTRLRAAERLVRLKANGSEIVTLGPYGHEIPVEDIFLEAERPRNLSESPHLL